MMHQKTFLPKATDQITWHFINAKSEVLGKLSTRVAKILTGKTRADFTPNMYLRDRVVITNADQVRVTGSKGHTKLYQWHTLYPKGLREETYDKRFARNPIKVVRMAIERMLPKNKLQKVRMANLFIYKGAEHPHQAQEKGK